MNCRLSPIRKKQNSLYYSEYKAYLPYTRNWKKTLPRAALPLVLLMTLPTSLCPKSNRLPLHQRKVLLNASSGVSVVTVRLVQTKTQPRLSVTTLTNTFRHTSSTTPRRLAVSQSATCALATSRLRARTTSTRRTLLLVITSHTSSRATRWCRTLSRTASS